MKFLEIKLKFIIFNNLELNNLIYLKIRVLTNIYNIILIIHKIIKYYSYK